METRKVKLPESGYVLEIRTALNTSVFRGYQQLLLKEARMGLSQPEKALNDIKMGVDVIYRGQEYVLKRCIVSLTDKDGNLVEPAFEKAMETPKNDGDIMFDIVDELIAGSTMTKKEKKTGPKPV